MSPNKKNGKISAKEIKRLKQYAVETERSLRIRGRYDGPRFFMSRMKLLEYGLDELQLTSKTLFVPSYVMFRDTRTGKQYQVRDSSITEYTPHRPAGLSSEYWDCECDDKYIHQNRTGKCPVCGALRGEMPDSRQNEIDEGTHFADE